MSLLSRFAKPLRSDATAHLAAPQRDTAPVATGEATSEGRTFRLDTLGQVCPFPLVEAKQAIRQIDSGDQLVIDFDCTQATDSIPNWAAQAGHAVTNFEQVGEASWTITVQKA